MRNSNLKLLGMILLLSSLSACGLIKNKDSGGSSNQDGNGLTIQGTTS